MRGKPLAMLIASITTLLAIVLIGWVVYAELNKQPTSAQAQQTPEIGAPPTLNPDLIAASPQNIEDILDNAQEGRLAGMDPDEPDRLSYEVFYDVLDPQPGGRFQVQAPVAWLYLRSGQAVQIKAVEASFSRPTGASQPESGRFRGDVVIHLFRERPETQTDASNSSGAITPANPSQPPMASMMTDSLSFDLSIGEVSTSDVVRIESPGALVSFKGLKLLVDQLEHRISYFGTDSDGLITITPDQLAQRSDSTDVTPAPKQAPDAQQAPASDLTHAIVFYHALFSRDVRLTWGDRQVTGDQLEAWTRLVDGALAEDAITPIGSSSNAKSATPTDGDVIAAEQPGADAIENQIVLAWAGPLVVKPMKKRPDELVDDEVAIRMTAPTSGEVVLSDQASGAGASCVSLDYHLTKAIVALSGRGASGVTATVPDLAESRSGAIRIDLRTGVGELPGPGVLRAVGNAAQPDPFDPNRTPREVSWRERCELLFATRDGSIDLSASSLLNEALFHGGVTARYDEIAAEGEFARVVFSQTPEGAATLRRVIIEQDVKVDAGAEGRLTTDLLDMQFGPSGPNQRLTPIAATAQGRVYATREGSTIRAALAEVALARDENDKVQLESFRARRDVHIDYARGVQAEADRVRLMPATRVMELIGEPAVLHLDEGAIEGGSMRIEDEARRLTVFGPGTLTYKKLRRGSLGYRQGDIKWTQSMVYDDPLGRAEFLGDCVATGEIDDLARDVARANRIILSMTPNITDSGEKTQAKRTPELLFIDARGSIEEREDGQPVTAQARRYKLDPTTESGLKLERLMFLEGPRVELDASANTMLVPGAGRLLLEDRRDTSADDEAPALKEGVSLRGTTLFELDGELFVDRQAGEAQMTRRVRLRQKDLNAGAVTQLECERLVAMLNTASPGDNSAQSDKPQLRRADASGAVYLAQGARQLIADRVMYNGSSGLAEATAAPGNVVTIFDAGGATPLTGDVLRWDLLQDRIQWFGAGETTLGR